MRISAVGANRSVCEHTVMDTSIESMIVKDDMIVFNAPSNQDPGIAKGLYTLTISIKKQEAFMIFETAISIDTVSKIKKLEEEIENLKCQLRDV